jgi:hypothetical protein
MMGVISKTLDAQTNVNRISAVVALNSRNVATAQRKAVEIALRMTYAKTAKKRSKQWSSAAATLTMYACGGR